MQYILGRKVGNSKVDAQSCLYYMLKYDIWGTFCCIAFENRFNGDWGLLKNQIIISHKKINKSSISTTLLFLGKFANSAITQPTTLLVYYLKREEGCFYLVLFLIRRRKRGHLMEKKNVNIQQKVMKFCRNWQIFPWNSDLSWKTCNFHYHGTLAQCSEAIIFK